MYEIPEKDKIVKKNFSFHSNQIELLAYYVQKNSSQISSGYFT